jgi:RimJ/RimL family protein N-acetyltransferase
MIVLMLILNLFEIKSAKVTVDVFGDAEWMGTLSYMYRYITDLSWGLNKFHWGQGHGTMILNNYGSF